MSLPTPDTNNVAGVAGASWPCSLDGRPYLLDFSRGSPAMERSIPLLRAQADTGGSWAESSLNPDDLIRRSVDTCHGGAGQKYRDRPTSDPNRFRRSRGVEVFEEQGEITLMRSPVEPADCGATSVAGSPYTFTGNRLLNVSNWMYVISGAQGIRYSNDLGATWSAQTGLPAQDILCWATNGYVILTGHENGNIYSVPHGGGAASQLFNSGASTIAALGYVKGRWMAADHAGNVFNPTDFTTPPNALPSALINFDFSTTGRRVTHFAEGNAHIYMAVTTASGGAIYKTAVKPDGTALDVPVQALKLPEGEDIAGLFGYLGFVFIATKTSGDLGVRMAEAGSDGTLQVGSRIILTDINPQSEVAFEGQDRYVWCSSNHLEGSEYNASETNRVGLVRLDLSTFIRPLTPAYAEDVSVAGTNDTVLGLANLGLVTDGNYGICFTVEKSGSNTDFYRVYASTRMATGEISFGKMNFGVTDQKTAMKLDLQFDVSGTGTITPWVEVDGTRTTFSALTSANEPGATVDIDALTGREFEMGLTLARGATATSTVLVKRATLRAFAKAERTREFILPLIISRRVTDFHSREHVFDTAAEINAIEAMLGTVVVLKLGTETEYVQVKDYQFDMTSIDVESGMLQGVCNVKVQAVV